MPEKTEQKSPPMNRAEIIEFLRENLSIRVEEKQFSNVNEVKLFLCGKVISSDVF